MYQEALINQSSNFLGTVTNYDLGSESGHIGNVPKNYQNRWLFRVI